jgi:hypothetical protein
MIHIAPTSHYAGVTIAGDYDDFNLLYDSLHNIVGLEEENVDFYNARIRVLGLCYDIRHAFMGNRECEFRDNGITREKMKWLGISVADQNLYYSCKTYYPELLFIMMALNDFIAIYEQKKAANQLWDRNITTVRSFQAAVMDSLSNTLKPQTFKLMQKNMSKTDRPSFSRFYTAYLDELNIRFLDWDAEKRLKNISIIAKHLAEQGKPYQETVDNILEAARENNCHPSQIKYGYEYPEYEEINW